jgi:uncharacterized membrane protein
MVTTWAWTLWLLVAVLAASSVVSAACDVWQVVRLEQGVEAVKNYGLLP